MFCYAFLDFFFYIYRRIYRIIRFLNNQIFVSALKILYRSGSSVCVCARCIVCIYLLSLMCLHNHETLTERLTVSDSRQGPQKGPVPGHGEHEDPVEGTQGALGWDPYHRPAGSGGGEAFGPPFRPEPLHWPDRPGPRPDRPGPRPNRPGPRPDRPGPRPDPRWTWWVRCSF